MKSTKQRVCPGCHKHCKEGAPRCKYGRRYFAKLNQQGASPCPCSKKNCKHKTKWESFVEPEGLVWKLLSTSRSIKKALRSKQCTEAHLLSGLTENEQQMLFTLLDRLSSSLQE